MFTNTHSSLRFSAVLLLAIVGALLLAPFGLTGAQAAPLSARGYTLLGDDKEGDPNSHPITRGELAKKVSNAANFEDDPGPQIFQDVDPTHKQYAYINRLANRGAVGGFPCGTVPDEPCVEPDNLPYYRPDADATRGQAAKMIAIAAGFEDEPTGQTFEDIPPGSTFYVWIEQLASRGVAEGFECGTLPNEPCVEPDNRPYYRPFDPIIKRDANVMIEGTFGDGGEE